MATQKLIKKLIDRIIEDEGGYVDHRADKGGRTKFGISQRAYPNLDIKNLTKEDAFKIYLRDYWLGPKLDAISEAIAGDPSHDLVLGKVLAAAVTSGPQTAFKCVQRALRANGLYTADDGRLGPKTLALLSKAGPGLLPALRSELASHYRCIVARDGSQAVFLSGWLKRAYE